MTDETPTGDKPEPVEPVFVEPGAVEAEPAVAEPVTEPEAPELVEPSTTAAATPAAVPTDVVEVPAHTDDIDNTVVEAPVAAPVAPVVAPVAAPQTVYVQAPTPPRKKSNRGVGVLIAILSTIIFIVVFGLVSVIAVAARTGVFAVDFLGDFSFYVPALFFLVGFVIVVLIVNRAGWWAHVIASLFVGVFVYFGTVGGLLLLNGITQHTPSEAGVLYAHALADPLVIAAALIAREVALWLGFAISARGRRVKARNAEARAAYESDLSERRAEYDRAATVSA